MKKTKLFGLLLAMIVGIGFTACEDDEDANISILIEGTVPDKVTVGEAVTISYSVTIDKNKLESIDILQKQESLYVSFEEIPEFDSNTSHTDNFIFTPTVDDIGIQEFAIDVTDNKGTNKIRTFSFEVVSAAGEIEIYEAKLLGSFTSSEAGSFYSTTNNQVYMNQPAFENQALIDFVYFYGSANQATIAAPDDAGAAAVYTNEAYGLSKWTTKRNATKFKISLKEQAEFDAIEDDALIVTESNLNNSSASKLVEGNVVAFETEANKKGLFLVKSISGTAGNSTITIQVKVQK